MKNFLKSVYFTYFLVSSLILAQDIDVNAIRTVDGRAKTIMEYLHDDTRLVPTKVFDNVYCIGSAGVVAWAITTSDGIILIDSMWDDKDAQMIEESFIKLGLNPNDLKYIIITHGHEDHYGGANYLREKYGAKTILTKVDTDLMYNLNTGANSPRSPKTKIDIFAKDQDKIVLGDTEIILVETPGHTAGCLSVIFPAKDKGKELVAMLWGGTGILKDKELQIKYKESAEYFSKLSQEKNASVFLTAHLFADEGYEKLALINSSNYDGKNPFVFTQEELKKYFDDLISKADETIKNNK